MKSLIILEELLKGFVFGILPFIFFILITSRTSLLGGIRSFIVLTGSMEPTVHVGTMVFTHPFELYKLNDVISFKRENRTITHRVIDVRNKEDILYYKTRGDANNVSDSELISKQDIIGKVFFSIPYIGRAVFFIKTIPGYLLLIVFPAVIYIIAELVHINKEMKKETEKRITQKLSHL